MKELNISQTEWQIGRTKVFLRSVVHEPLEDARKQVVHINAVRIQSAWRRYAEKRKFHRIKVAVLRIQHAYIGWKLRIEFLRKRRAAIVIQSHLRGVFAREVYFLSPNNGNTRKILIFFLANYRLPPHYVKCDELKKKCVNVNDSKLNEKNVKIKFPNNKPKMNEKLLKNANG